MIPHIQIYMTAGEIPAERMSTNLLNISMNSIEVNPFY